VRKHVRHPQDLALVFLGRQYLQRGVMVHGPERPLDGCVRQPSRIVVQGDDQLPDHGSAGERRDASPVFIQVGIGEHPREQPVRRADITDRGPDAVRRRGDQELFAYPCHVLTLPSPAPPGLDLRARCDDGLVLISRGVVAVDGVALFDVGCRHEPRRGPVVEQAQQAALVFVRRGAFQRTVNGVITLLDPTLAYAVNPGDEQRYDHPHTQGDDCTYLTLTPPLVEHLTGGQHTLPRGPFPTPPALDLAQRTLLARAARAGDPDAVFEATLRLAEATLQQGQPMAPKGARTRFAHRTLVRGVRESLADKPDLSLTELANKLTVSPHHLSRVFRAITGSTVSRHRMRLRARAALQRLADGERDLGRLAADLGFADQSHMSRVLSEECGQTPARLRQLLGR
jgi:AraC-like DNA-binding protein